MGERTILDLLRREALTFQQIRSRTGISARKLDRFLHRMKDLREVAHRQDGGWQGRHLSARFSIIHNEPVTLWELEWMRNTLLKEPRRDLFSSVEGIQLRGPTWKPLPRRGPQRFPYPVTNRMTFHWFPVRCGICKNVIHTLRWAGEEVPPPPKACPCGARSTSPITFTPNRDLDWSQPVYSGIGKPVGWPRWAAAQHGREFRYAYGTAQISGDRVMEALGLSMEDLAALECGFLLADPFDLLMSLFGELTTAKMAAWREACWAVPLIGPKEIVHDIEMIEFVRRIGAGMAGLGGALIQCEGRWERV